MIYLNCYFGVVFYWYTPSLHQFLPPKKPKACGAALPIALVSKWHWHKPFLHSPWPLQLFSPECHCKELKPSQCDDFKMHKMTKNMWINRFLRHTNSWTEIWCGSVWRVFSPTNVRPWFCHIPDTPHTHTWILHRHVGEHQKNKLPMHGQYHHLRAHK